ncbi:PRC-barrel domain-containing protein [Fictibacillus aquaticus]|uniref:Photosystem reaction center subunit H n=1 Tax=Fictibacillus aquaticus TaxID=2021314 RepID=A0A235FFF9_9BACL|nr:PRC-barrel domain-containing protein [Fictibacillus aquaticus]OYD59733.1 photosystem reaction center subunit H [Fictibacillus aquaticus]
MKKSNQFIGLPIISIMDGTEVGNVKSLVVNSAQGTVDFLTVEHEDWQISVRAVPFKKIVGVGEFAVTIEDRTSIFDLTEIPIANELVQKKISIAGAKMIDRKGQFIGEATEFFIDEENGSILGVAITTQNKEVVLASEQVITYGRDLLVVKEQAELKYLAKAEDLLKKDAEEEASEPETGFNAVKEMQFQRLAGRTVTKDIYTKSGSLLFANGTLLKKEDIQAAQEEGPSVLAELSMNVAG